MSTLTRLGKSIQRVITTQPYWPNSENSAGSCFGTVDGEKYWRLKDQQCSAFLTFRSLVGELEVLLRKHTETSAIRVLWRAYLTGEEKSLCFLGILFCCTDADYRNLAARQIDASPKPLIPSGVIIKYRSGLPGLNGTLMPLGSEGAIDEVEYGLPERQDSYPFQSHGSSHATLGFPSHAPPKDDSNRKDESTLFEPPKRPDHRYFAASSLVRPGFAVHAESPDGQSRVATLGGRIRIRGVDYFVTSAHPFTNEQFATRSTRLPDPSSESRKQAISSWSYSSYTDGNPELDYVLIKPDSGIYMVDFAKMGYSMQHAELALPHFSSEEYLRNLRDTMVISYRASSGSSSVPTSGQIDTVPDFLRSGQARPQEVYAVQFDSELAPGDSGSWVFDAAGNSLHGHIVAGVPEDGLAFIVPAYKVFENIEKAYPRLVSRILAVPRQWSHNSPDSIELLPGVNLDPSVMKNAQHKAQQKDNLYDLQFTSSHTGKPWAASDFSEITSSTLHAFDAASPPTDGRRRYEQQSQRAGPWDGVGYVPSKSEER